jgi:hypothetical protein
MGYRGKSKLGKVGMEKSFSGGYSVVCAENQHLLKK